MGGGGVTPVNAQGLFLTQELLLEVFRKPYWMLEIYPSQPHAKQVAKLLYYLSRPWENLFLYE